LAFLLPEKGGGVFTAKVVSPVGRHAYALQTACACSDSIFIIFNDTFAASGCSKEIKRSGRYSQSSSAELAIYLAQGRSGQGAESLRKISMLFLQRNTRGRFPLPVWITVPN
jgi:hypothetical protein